MPGVVIFAIGTGVVWLGLRALNRAMARVTADLRAAEKDLTLQDQPAVRLERDPVTGIYRPLKSKGNSTR